VSCVFQNIDPPPPSPPGECVLPPQQRRGYTLTGWSLERGGGVSIFWKTQDIGLASYSNNLYPVNQRQGTRIVKEELLYNCCSSTAKTAIMTTSLPSVSVFLLSVWQLEALPILVCKRGSGWSRYRLQLKSRYSFLIFAFVQAQGLLLGGGVRQKIEFD
jgi:hypothetical protein